MSGRGRAKNSRYVLVVGTGPNYGWLERKEALNEIRNELMQKATIVISAMSPQLFQSSVRELQNQAITLKAVRKVSEKKLAELTSQFTHYELLCGSCGRPVAQQGDVRVVQGAHRVVVSKEIFSRVAKRGGESRQCVDIAFQGSLVCADPGCGYQLGTTCQ